MKKGIMLTGMVAAGFTAAFLLNAKNGPKRRKLLKKKANSIFRMASGVCREYSSELKPYWETHRANLVRSATDSSKLGFEKLQEAKHRGWPPSARMLGAIASAIAFYGIGRNGLAGGVLRTFSLGLLTRALYAPR